jgi:cytoskeleton-associated protein 5
VEKSLGSSRQGTRQKAVDALLFFVELDTPDPVIEDILPFLGHRIPKLVAGSVTTITEIVANFGTKKIAPALIAKILKTHVPKLFAHADKNVRAGAQQLVVELFRWMGDAVRELVMVQQDFLKPVQQKELESEFARVSAEPAPEQKRLLRSQQLELDQENADSDEDEEEAFGGSGGGLLDTGEPVEILSKIPDQFSSRLSSTKWKDRKEVLEELLPVLTGAPRIKPDDYNEIMRLFAKSVVKDANIQVVMLSANCIESFAKGLRGEFTRYVPIVLGPLLERLKEKKAAVAEALKAALQMVYKVTASTTTLEDSFLDPILEAFKHKTPQVKIESAAFLVFILKLVKTTPKAAPEGKAIINASLKLLGDTQELVRIGGMEVLGVMMKLLGERAMGPYLESVDDIKKGKIQEFYKTAEVKAKPPKASAPATSAAKKKPAASEPGLVRKLSTASKSGEKTGLKKMLSPLKQALQSKQSLAKRSASGTSASPEPPVFAAASPTSQRQLQRPGAKPSPMATSSFSTPEQPEQPRQQASIQQASSYPSQQPQPQQQPQQQQPQQQQQSFSYQAQPPVSTSSAEDQALIAQLRSENEALKAELQSTSSSRTKLLEELHALQNKVTGLLEAHTRDILQIKSKETQLVRAQSDLEVVKLQLELEVEKRKNLMFTNAGSQASIQSPPLPPVVVPRPQPPQQHQQQTIPQQQHYFNDDSVLDHSGHHSPLVSESEIPKRVRPMSYHPDSSPMGLGALGSGIPSFPGGFTGSSGSSLDHNGGSPGSGSPNSRGSNWKRAAEVTVQLKARIEAMKARQNKALGEAI